MKELNLDISTLVHPSTLRWQIMCGERFLKIMFLG